MKNIQTINAISEVGLAQFSPEKYQIHHQIDHPHAILVRSSDMHEMRFSDNLLAVGRAGAGVNNIPIERLSQKGVAVFNAPGANANAVKELVVGALFMAARNLFSAADYVRTLDENTDSLASAIEAAKKQFAGSELVGKKMGVIGLGAIGVQVANAAASLKMEVFGYDPVISVHNAWHLNADVHQCLSLEAVLAECDFISFHVPLIEATKHLLNHENIRLLKSNATVMNFSRQGIIEEAAILQALDDQKIKKYITDFPTEDNKNHPKVLAFPHLGASTQEAEDQSAKMVAQQLVEFIEQGWIANSVNLPELKTTYIPTNSSRLAIVNANQTGMLAKLTDSLGRQKINIIDLMNKSRNNIAYNLIDLEGQLSPQQKSQLLADIQAHAGVLSVRFCGT